MRSPAARAALALGLAAALAGCGQTSKPASSPAPTPSQSRAPSQGAAAAGHPSVTVSPATGLRNGQQVTVVASGFPASGMLVITECADKGTATGPADCDLAAVQTVTSSASGGVHASFTVNRGPFGANHIVCSAQQRCLVSVSQPTATNPVEATEDISFAAG